MGYLLLQPSYDPRDKLACVEFYLEEIYGDKTYGEVQRVRSLFYNFLIKYQGCSEDYALSTCNVLGKHHAIVLGSSLKKTWKLVSLPL